jgi:hypothetical protein
MEEQQKNILLSIYKINQLETLFFNKIKFLNFGHLIQIMDAVSEEQLKDVAEKIVVVEQALSAIKPVIDSLYIPSVELVSTYDRTNYLSDANAS